MCNTSARDPHRPEGAQHRGHGDASRAVDQRRRAGGRVRCRRDADHGRARRRQGSDLRLQRSRATRAVQSSAARGDDDRDRHRLQRAAAARTLLRRAGQGIYPESRCRRGRRVKTKTPRHWYPCIDFPNHQQTSEVIVTVPAGMISIGNGELKSVTRRQARAHDDVSLVSARAARHLPAQPDRRRVRRDQARRRWHSG